MTEYIFQESKPESEPANGKGGNGSSLGRMPMILSVKKMGEYQTEVPRDNAIQHDQGASVGRSQATNLAPMRRHGSGGGDPDGARARKWPPGPCPVARNNLPLLIRREGGDKGLESRFTVGGYATG